MDAYLANLDALSGQLLIVLTIAVLFVVLAVVIAVWISRGASGLPAHSAPPTVQFITAFGLDGSEQR